MQNPHKEERPLAILSVFEKDGEKPFHKKIVSQDDKVTTKGMLWWKRNTVRTAKENLCDATLEMLKLADKYKEQKNIGEEAVNISKRTFQAFKEIDRLLEV